MKRVISVLLAVVMVFALLPTVVVAVDQDESTGLTQIVYLERDLSFKKQFMKDYEVKDFEVEPSPTVSKAKKLFVTFLGTESIYDRAKGDYAYKDFDKRSHPAQRKALYNYLFALSKEVYTSLTNINKTSGYYIADRISLAEFGLTTDEAVETFFMFKHDNPLFYFWDYSMLLSSKYAYFCVFSDYVSGTTRGNCNDLIEKKLKEYSNVYNAGKSDYASLLNVYTKLCDETTYAYQSNGEPETAGWAHCIMGCFQKGSGVCEAYARTLGLVLNYCGLQNIPINGVSEGVDHIWNAVNLNGKYYYVDATWDDAYSALPYFCKGTGNFKNHTAYTSKGTSLKFLYDMPSTLSKDDYKITSNSSITRIFGSDRYKTSMIVAEELKEAMNVSKFSNIVVASGENFPDALSGSYLAVVKKAPIIMVNAEKGQTVGSDLINYICNNLASGGNVYLLGGTSVINTDFEKTMQVNLGKDRVKRLAGKDRYDTNLAILKEAGVKGKQVMVCDAYNFADALSVSCLGKPILIIDKNSGQLTPEQRTFLKNAAASTYCIIGGPSAVPETLAQDIKATTGTGYQRIGGNNRFETSELIAVTFAPNAKKAVLATGSKFPDGLCGGPLAYQYGAPILLATNSEGEYTYAVDFVKRHSIVNIAALGGTGVLSDKTLRTVVGNPSSSIKVEQYK